MQKQALHLEEDRRWITRFCEALGIPLDLDASFSGREIPWTGQLMTGIGGQSKKPLPVEDIYHDIAHWVVADPENRQYVGFGCGPAPDRSLSRDEAYDEGHAWLKPSGRQSTHDGPGIAREDEESIASAIGILLQRKVSLEAAIVHAAEHDWLFFTTKQSRAFGLSTGTYDPEDVCYKSLDDFWATLRKVIEAQPHGRVAVQRLLAAEIDIFA
jgi:hypothetical protein